ncbi:Ca2+:H+ antiporter [Phlyctema vagabunda]|uniref:Vacuolar calcium ion transporter n=1 Tax=Phlyctema vagabunda TaxID=108571 RepID=A0ABR4P4P8_9HELO
MPRRTEPRRQSQSRRQDIELRASNSNGMPASPQPVHEKPHRNRGLPMFNHNGHKVTPGIEPEGESGRRGIHPFHFFKIVWTSASDASRAVNVLWPVVPAAIAVRYARPDMHLTIFILNYIAMVPCANLIGFAGQELARKLPKVFGVLVETTLGSIVEVVLFMVLLVKGEHQVIQAAILGSILATLLLCLGLCFFVGGMKRDEQEFDPAVSEVGSGLLLVAGFGLILPAAFRGTTTDRFTVEELDQRVLNISRISAIILMVAYFFYLWFQMHTHHGLYDAILMKDEHKDEDRQEDLNKNKLTLTECVLALAVSIALVSIVAIALVGQIHYIVEERHISDAFIGLILVPLVEKFAEHLTAIDEAWDNQMNFALAHVLGATIQTALFNAPLVVIASWGMGTNFSLDFELFDIISLILSILVVGRFLSDKKSNYLEGALCVLVYMIIAAAAYYYPNPIVSGAGESETTSHAVARSLLALKA